jgi:uncharacterized protein (DUF1800 family)
MRSFPPKIALLVVLTLVMLILSLPLALGKRKDKYAGTSAMDDKKRAAHALNRLTFGPRPGDVERMLTTGVDKWIDEQLQPEKIDDSALDARLAPFQTLGMNTREMLEQFPPRQVIKAVSDGKLALPVDPVTRAVYETQLDRFQDKQIKKAAKSGATPSPAGATTGQEAPSRDEQIRRREERFNADELVRELVHLPPDQRIEAVLQMSSASRRAVADSIKGDQPDRFFDGVNPRQREDLLAMSNPEQMIDDELIQGKLLRATYSERQLGEVMSDFWFNHFNVFLGKDADRFLLTSYERDVIRPRALGKFEDLLVATAQSPAMLYYLDNWLSVGPNSDVANGIKRRNGRNERKYAKTTGPVKQSKGKRNGLNENYGRELMELHTLGVSGGYTQRDVTEVARVLTGWTLKQPRDGDYSFSFTFDERMHEPGEKTVLGHRIKPNGEKEGYEVLHILAHQPATAKFVCTKLAQRFVSDNPPPELVDRMTQTYMKKDGDIREVLKTIFHSREFWAAEDYRAKVKTPLEFVVSALRASDADVSDAMSIARQLQNMGMPLYGMQPPTGYSMKAEAWVNSSSLLGRMNFALALTTGKLKGVQVDSGKMLGTTPALANSEQALTELENRLLVGDVSLQTHATLAAQLPDSKIRQGKLDDPTVPPNVGGIAGLILGSPEFQRR